MIDPPTHTLPPPTNRELNEMLVRRAAVDAEIMDCLLKCLEECDEAKELLHKNGYGVIGTGILESVKEVLVALSATAR